MRVCPTEITQTPTEIISLYTARQAIEDGLLQEVESDVTTRIGFPLPVRVTPGVMALAESRETLEDILWVAHIAILHAPEEALVDFLVRIDGVFKQFLAALDTTSGPAIHLMRPDEY